MRERKKKDKRETERRRILGLCVHVIVAYQSRSIYRLVKISKKYFTEEKFNFNITYFHANAPNPKCLS